MPCCCYDHTMRSFERLIAKNAIICTKNSMRFPKVTISFFNRAMRYTNWQNLDWLSQAYDLGLLQIDIAEW